MKRVFITRVKGTFFGMFESGEASLTTIRGAETGS
jgi:hypothetical protein